MSDSEESDGEKLNDTPVIPGGSWLSSLNLLVELNFLTQSMIITLKMKEFERLTT